MATTTWSTSTISGSCDVRVIWGGDVTVKRIRSVAIPVHATELVFADRFSMAAIGTEAYRGLSAQGRDRLAELFFTDAYWFDQLALLLRPAVAGLAPRIRGHFPSTSMIECGPLPTRRGIRWTVLQLSPNRAGVWDDGRCRSDRVQR